jgi:hypothetical protein
MADWLPTREQDLVDLCGKWTLALADQAKITAFGWDQTECTAVLGVINAFLTARTAYEADDSSAKQLAKDEAKEEAKDAMRDFANTSIRFNKKMGDADKLIFGSARQTKFRRHTERPRASRTQWWKIRSIILNIR